jgi:hypothetical protein
MIPRTPSHPAANRLCPIRPARGHVNKDVEGMPEPGL